MFRRLLTATLAPTVLAAVAAAADWPSFRGDPAQTGVSAEQLDLLDDDEA